MLREFDMAEKLPELEVVKKYFRDGFSFAVTNSMEEGLTEAQADEIIRRCEKYEGLVEAIRESIKAINSDPVQAIGEWETGMYCGLEDRDITDKYQACMYGYQNALDKVQEWIIDILLQVLSEASE